MDGDKELTFQQRSLFQQGFQCFTSEELRQYQWGLRFTPAACTSITVVALFTQTWWLALAVSTLGIWAFLAPAGHPMDFLYNKVVRHAFGMAALPPNPLQRRLACLAAGVLNFAIGWLFFFGLNVAAYGTGALLVTLQVIVITTHFCTLSWLYELGMRALGMWHVPTSGADARQRFDGGAILIDVRSPIEFAVDRLVGAKNVPVDCVGKYVNELRDHDLLVYCRSGLRSQIAREKLQGLGLTRVSDIGAMGSLGDHFELDTEPAPTAELAVAVQAS